MSGSGVLETCAGETIGYNAFASAFSMSLDEASFARLTVDKDWPLTGSVMVRKNVPSTRFLWTSLNTRHDGPAKPVKPPLGGVVTKAESSHVIRGSRGLSLEDAPKSFVVSEKETV